MGELKLGVQLGYWQREPHRNFVEVAQEAERLGYDSVWTAEAWGSDAFTPLAWIGAHTSRIRLGTAIVQISARTPASTAMHALTLDHLSRGRMIGRNAELAEARPGGEEVAGGRLRCRRRLGRAT